MDKRLLKEATRKVFGPSFPRVEIGVEGSDLVIYGAANKRAVPVVYSDGAFVSPEMPGEPSHAWPAHVFDVGHFLECCQAISALYEVKVRFYDYATRKVAS